MTRTITGFALPALSGQGDVGRLWTLRAFALLELHARTFGERLEAVAGDVAVMDEEILRTLVGSDEAIPLRIVEPLDDSVAIENTSLIASRTCEEGAEREPDSF